MRTRVSPEILQEYARYRDQARLEQEMRTEEVYRRIPRIAEIDRQMGQVAMDIARWVLKHPDDHEKGALEIRATLDALRQERRTLLGAHGLSEDFLETVHRCPHCRDTGYTEDGNPCRCLRQRLIDNACRSANLGPLLKDQHFGAFNLNLFSESPYPGKKLSPRDNMRHIASAAQRFVTQFESLSQPNLIFHGGAGLGKTFLCSCVARALLDRGYTVLYQTAFSIAETMENYRFGRREGTDAETAYRMIYDCDLLIVDDLGTELTNTFTTVEFFNILNTRLMNQRKMLFSTNLAPTELVRTYGERVSSRLLSHFELMEFYGEDLRFIV